MDSTQEQYNDIPVFYCKHCLSIKIKTVLEDSDLDYCDECGSTDIEQAHIGDWEKLYKERYGFNYLDKHIEYGRD